MTIQSRRISELTWFGPFLAVTLIVASMLRPLPSFPRPANSRIVVDAGGTEVPIELPFRGVAMDVQISPYLAPTQAPETIAVAGGQFLRIWFAQEILGLVYPDLLKRDKLWTDSMFANQETLLAYDPGAYITGTVGPHGAFSVLRSIGLPVIYTSNQDDKNYDELCYHAARIKSALIEHPERGEALVADAKRAYADLAQELKPETLGAPIRILQMFSNSRKHTFGALHYNAFSNIYLERVNAVTASIGWGGAKWDDTERVLAMDPDVIFLNGRKTGMPGYVKWAIADGPEKMLADPRWAGLKAVQTGRVYRLPGWAPGLPENLHLQPLWVRWMAEVLHPDRMQPKLRTMLRDHFVKWFNYRLSDEEIDARLHLDENGDRPGYARFQRQETAIGAQESNK